MRSVVTTVFALGCAVSLSGLMGCKKVPELTPGRINQVLVESGEDKLWIRVVAVPNNGKLTCAAKPKLVVNEDEQDLAIRAGWIERKCPDNPIQMRIPTDNYARTQLWKYEWVPVEHAGEKEDWAAWSIPMASWVAKGARVEPGDGAREKKVILSGSWSVTEEGRLAQHLKWKPISATEREVRFVYANDQWNLKKD